jgi:hypothetical protein
VQKVLREKGLLTEKTQSFLRPSSCLGAGDLGGCMWPRVTLGFTGCLRGHMWPQGVVGSLGGSGVALGVTDSLVGLQIASRGWVWPCGVIDGHGGSWVASRGRS